MLDQNHRFRGLTGLLLLFVLGCFPSQPIPTESKISGSVIALESFAESAETGQAIVLEGVTVIDGLGTPPRPEQSVLIEGDRIVAVGDAALFEAPADARRLPLHDKFVIPGLFDLHAHYTILPMDDDGGLSLEPDVEESEEVLKWLLAYGITTIRNPAAPAEAAVELRERVARGELLGPEIRTAGNPLNRTRASFGPFVATPTEGDVRAEVRRQAKLDVDFIKVYSTLAPNLIAAAIEEAHDLGLPVIGHLQRTTWTEAARLGIDAITHGAPWSAAYLPEDVRAEYRGSIRDRMAWLEEVDFDGPEIQEMIRELAERRIPVDPTLTVYRTKFMGKDPVYKTAASHPAVPSSVVAIWQDASFTADWSEADFARGRQAWPRVLELTRRLFEAGVLLTTGSDFPNHLVVPGVSLHKELELLVEAGIPPIEVLRIATSNGARALGLEKETGSIEVGKRADLLVLSKDPSKDITATRSIEWVLTRGRALSPAEIVPME